jgi:type II secretory pathway component PulF
MPLYAYVAVNEQGRSTTGTLPAANRAAAVDTLTGHGLFAVSIEENRAASASGTAVLTERPNRAAATPPRRPALTAPFAPQPVQAPAPHAGAAPAPSPDAGEQKGWRRLFHSQRVAQTNVESFSRELANLQSAGVSLSRSLQLLSRESSQPAARRQWQAVHDDVANGSSLAAALARWPKSFPPVHVAMVRAGETGGFLEVVLSQIADLRARERDLLGKVKAAMIYPAILATVAVCVLIFLMTFFIPRFSPIFEEFGQSLPALTRAIVLVSNGVRHYGLYAAGALVVGIIALRRLTAEGTGRRALERFILRVPGVGHVLARFALVRFCRMLGTLAGAGVPLITALRVAREAIGNQTLADAVNTAIEQVQQGTALARSLAECPTLFPPSVIEMIAVAEETGRLDSELVRLAGNYENDLDRRLRMLVAAIEPIILFIMAALIGTVVVGMLLPVFALQDLIQ